MATLSFPFEPPSNVGSAGSFSVGSPAPHYWLPIS